MDNVKAHKRIVNPTMVKDAIYYTRADSGATSDKASGVIIGMVAGLMACGLTYNQAIVEVKHALPAGYRSDSLPAAWAYDLTR